MFITYTPKWQGNHSLWSTEYNILPCVEGANISAYVQTVHRAWRMFYFDSVDNGQVMWIMVQTKHIIGELAESSKLNMNMLWINETDFIVQLFDVPEIDNKNL